jgi:hypothetical protein
MNSNRSTASQGSWRWIMLFVVLLAYAWRILDLNRQSLWRDEIDAIFFALRDLPDMLSMFTNPARNGVLYYLTLRPWLRLAGTSEFALRYPSVLAGVLSVPLLWQVGRRLMPAARTWETAGEPDVNSTRRDQGRYRSILTAVIRSPATLAALFLAANPYQLWYAQEGKMYALITFLALLAVWFWLRGIGRGGWHHWLGFLLAVSIGMYSHLLMILLIPLFFIWFLIAWPQSKFHWLGFSLALAGLTLPYLPLIWWQWAFLMSSQELTALNFIPLGEMLEAVLLYQSHGILPPVNLIWLAPIFILGLYGLLLGFRATTLNADDSTPRLALWRRHLLIVSWLILPIFFSYLLSLRQPLFLPRYVIWISPALLMLVGLGIQLVGRNSGKKAVPLLLLLLIYLFGFWGYLGWQQKKQEIKPDLRGAVRTIFERRQEDDLLILQIPHMEFAYRYYSSDQGSNPFEESEDRLGWWFGGLWTNNGLSDAEAWPGVDQEMKKQTEGASIFWVLLSEAEMWDERDFMGQWLDQNAVLIESIEFHDAQVDLYHMARP